MSCTEARLLIGQDDAGVEGRLFSAGFSAGGGVFAEAGGGAPSSEG